MENKTSKKTKAINDFLDNEKDKKKSIKVMDGLIERIEHVYVDSNGRQLLND